MRLVYNTRTGVLRTETILAQYNLRSTVVTRGHYIAMILMFKCCTPEINKFYGA